MNYMINNRNYSQNELYNIVALRIYQQATDQTIGSIIAYTRNGIGAKPVSCHDLVSTIQQSRVTSLRNIYTAVEQDQVYWKPEAMRIYKRWNDAHSQLVQRYFKTSSVLLGWKTRRLNSRAGFDPKGVSNHTWTQTDVPKHTAKDGNI